MILSENRLPLFRIMLWRSRPCRTRSPISAPIFRATLKGKGESGLPDIAEKLSELLKNPAFVSETFTEDTPIGRRELWHDPATDVYVLAHVQEGGKVGKPHSHGASWAIYGTARGVTEMTEWRRVNPASEDNVVLEKS